MCLTGVLQVRTVRNISSAFVTSKLRAENKKNVNPNESLCELRGFCIERISLLRKVRENSIAEAKHELFAADEISNYKLM